MQMLHLRRCLVHAVRSDPQIDLLLPLPLKKAVFFRLQLLKSLIGNLPQPHVAKAIRQVCVLPLRLPLPLLQQQYQHEGRSQQRAESLWTSLWRPFVSLPVRRSCLLLCNGNLRVAGPACPAKLNIAIPEPRYPRFFLRL